MLVEAASDFGDRSPSNDCIKLNRCLLKGEVIGPAFGDARCKAVLGDSPDLPAGPALALQLALLAQTGQPAAAIMDAESRESGEILSAGLHDGHAALVVSSAVPAPASSSLPSASVQTHADIAAQKGAGGIDVPCFLDGGRLTYEDSLAAHGYQRYRLTCTFHASCFKSSNAGEVQMSRFGHVEPVAFPAVWHLQGRPGGYF